MMTHINMRISLLIFMERNAIIAIKMERSMNTSMNITMIKNIKIMNINMVITTNMIMLTKINKGIKKREISILMQHIFMF